jgi:uncharacterized protein YdaU (DUF1376 family)
MSKPAAMPIFGDAYIADTRHLSLEEHGAYYLLLLIAWRSEDCSLPDDDKRLAQMLGISPAKWAKLKPTIMAFWALERGRWTQKRQKKEHDFVTEKRAKNADAAKRRWNGQATENKGSGRSERTSERTSERICQNDAPPPPYKKPSVSTRAKQSLPDEWVPQPFGEDSDAAVIEAGWSEADRKGQMERFRDHHRARGNKFADWQAAWGTWVRNSVQFGRQAKPATPNSDAAYVERTIEEIRRRTEWEASQKAAAR